MMNAIAINYHWNPEQEAQNWINQLDLADQLELSVYLIRILTNKKVELARCGLINSLDRVFGADGNYVFNLLSSINYQVSLKTGSSAEEIMHINSIIQELEEEVDDLNSRIYELNQEMSSKEKKIKRLEQKCETLNLV